MKLRAARTGLFVTYSDGRVRRFSWVWLAPLLGWPLLLFLALAFQSQPVVRYYMGKGLKEPAYAGSAARLFVEVNRGSLENLLLSQPEPLESQLPTLKLVIGNNTIGDMMRALAQGDPVLDHEPGGDKPYFPAILVNAAGKPMRGQLCLRGANQWHHRPEKPSLRLRVRQEDVIDRRFIELSRPEDVLGMKNWLPDQLGRGLGLISDRGEHVRLYLNDKCFGVYLCTMRAEEPLALLNGRLPGTFFKADVFEQELRPSMWRSPREPVWALDGEVEEPFTLALFDRFLAATQEPPSLASLLELESVLDTERYARWAALQIASTSVHTDDFHNHLYFANGYQGKLEAVPWDVNGFGVHVTPTVPPDVLLSPPMRLISRDPRWVHRRNQILAAILSGPWQIDRLEAEIDAEVARMRKDLEADENLSAFEWTHVGLIEIPCSVRHIGARLAELKAFARARDAFLRSYLADAKVSVEPGPAGSRVTVWGNVAVLVQREDGAPVPAHGWSGAPSLLYPGLSEELDQYREFSYERGLPYAHARPAPLVYEVGAPPEQLRFRNAISGGMVTPVPPPGPGGKVRSFSPDSFPPPPTERVLGPGDVRLERDLITEPGQRLVILAGTRLLLAPGVGIYCQGDVVAEGSADAPIELLPLGNEPWATFGVVGAGADRARFRHLRVRGGSTGSRLARWRGMFALHGAPGLQGQGEARLEDCVFEGSAGDDAVNLAEVVARVERCRFTDSASDALDLDGSRATVTGCTFEGTGRDGLETSYGGEAVVRDTSFTRTRGSALVAGQRSRVVVRKATIEEAGRGVSINDGARLLLVECEIAAAQVAVHAERRQYHHGGRGGTGALLRCTLRDNRTEIEAASRSHIHVVETGLFGIVDAPPDRLRTIGELDPAVWGELLARVE